MWPLDRRNSNTDVVSHQCSVSQCSQMNEGMLNNVEFTFNNIVLHFSKYNAPVDRLRLGHLVRQSSKDHYRLLQHNRPHCNMNAP